MFQLTELESVVRIAPSNFSKPLKDVALETLKVKYESTISPEIGYVVLITDIKVDKVGKVIPGDGATYHRARFNVLTFFPKIQEVVEGEVVEITDFGAFIRTGPADALLHVSQITDDYLTSDVRQGIIQASSTHRVLKIGSKIRVRITAVSLGRGAALGKIGVTCRQPFLGAFEWIEEDVKSAHASKDSKKGKTSA